MVNVLLVEDSVIAQKVARFALEAQSCKIDVVANGKDAMTAIENNHYDLVLMDIGLPDIDGLTVTETLRSSNSLGRVVPIVALTAHVDPHIRQDSLSVGMTDFIKKPLTKEMVGHLLKRYVFTQKRAVS